MRNAQTELPQKDVGIRVQLATVDEKFELPGFAAEKNIFCHSQIVENVQLLMNKANAMLGGFRCGVDRRLA